MIDVAFKQLLGQEKNKNLTKGLLEHVFDVDIEELFFVNVEHPGESLEDRVAVFDIQCRSLQIGEFIVEMQVREQKNFSKRALFYSTFPITAQASKGDWDFNYKPVFFLGLLNFKMHDDDGNPLDGYIHRFSIRNDVSGNRLTDALRFVFMEVKTFNKANCECKTFEDKFLYYFKNLPTFVEKPDTQQDGYFEELLIAAEYSNMTKAEREAYNRRLKIMRDNHNADAFAREKAIEEGRAEANRDNAAKMLREAIPLEVIQRVTGLSVDEIRELE